VRTCFFPPPQAATLISFPALLGIRHYPAHSLNFIKIPSPALCRLSMYFILALLVFSREDREPPPLFWRSGNFRHGPYIRFLMCLTRFLCRASADILPSNCTPSLKWSDLFFSSPQLEGLRGCPFDSSRSFLFRFSLPRQHVRICPWPVEWTVSPLLFSCSRRREKHGPFFFHAVFGPPFFPGECRSNTTIVRGRFFQNLRFPSLLGDLADWRVLVIPRLAV